jgi:hypothetical protein
MRLSLVLVFFVATLSGLAPAGPHFSQYRATSQAGRPGKVLPTDAKSRKYATMLREASHRKADFAGHYILATWECGAACIMAAAIDAKSGSVSWLPFTVCCWDVDIGEPFEFLRSSRLLIVHGSRDEQGGGVHFYKFDGKYFSEVSEE